MITVMMAMRRIHILTILHTIEHKELIYIKHCSCGDYSNLRRMIDVGTIKYHPNNSHQRWWYDILFTWWLKGSIKWTIFLYALFVQYIGSSSILQAFLKAEPISSSNVRIMHSPFRHAWKSWDTHNNLSLRPAVCIQPSTSALNCSSQVLLYINARTVNLKTGAVSYFEDLTWNQPILWMQYHAHVHCIFYWRLFSKVLALL